MNKPIDNFRAAVKAWLADENDDTLGAVFEAIMEVEVSGVLETTAMDVSTFCPAGDIITVSDVTAPTNEEIGVVAEVDP